MLAGRYAQDTGMPGGPAELQSDFPELAPRCRPVKIPASERSTFGALRSI